jgi:MFS family permease
LTAQAQSHPDLTERIYDFITNEEDGRVCESIPEDACTDVPRNFFLNVGNGTATKLAERIASPELVLPWFMAALGAPGLLTGFLVPIRQAGALLPQLAVAGRIRRFSRRKWFWVVAGIVQSLALALMALGGLLLDESAAALGVILFLALFSLARGVGSVAYKEVLAKTVPQGRRGRLLALRSVMGGLLALLAGIGLRLFLGEDESLTPYIILIATAAGLWAIGVLLFTLISEPEGTTEGGRNALQEARAGLHLLQENPNFVQFILARGLLLSVRLSIPFYALYARQETGADLGNLGTFVIAASLAQLLSSPIWGRFADRSSRTVMMTGGGLAILTGVFALLIGMLPGLAPPPLLFAFIFLVIGIAQAGVRLGRKTYLVDGAPGDQRPLYVALSNTLIGVVTLFAGVFGLIADLISVEALLLVFIILATLGVLVAWQMPEAENLAAA